MMPGPPEPVDGRAGHVRALDEHRALGRRHQPGGHAGDGGLADAVRAEQRDRFAGLDGERHVEQGAERSVAGRDLVELEDGAS